MDQVNLPTQSRFSNHIFDGDESKLMPGMYVKISTGTVIYLDSIPFPDRTDPHARKLNLKAGQNDRAVDVAGSAKAAGFTNGSKFLESLGFKINDAGDLVVKTTAEGEFSKLTKFIDGARREERERQHYRRQPFQVMKNYVPPTPPVVEHAADPVIFKWNFANF
uniref:Uncharacterized protein n=1 Tax=Panagrolaimus sp. ES5 TaxID=591445 RepID=A0AC34G1X0_9BILA